MTKGWVRESARHALAAKKIKTVKTTTEIKVPIGKKIKSTLAGIFQGLVPDDLHHAVVLDFQTHQSILKEKESLLEQEEGTLNRPAKVKQLKSEIKLWKNDIVDDKRRIKFLANKYNLDYDTLIKTAQQIER